MQETSDTGRPRRSRVRIAGYLALTAIASDALLLVLTSGNGPNLGLPLALLSSGTWILAVLLLSPIRDAPLELRLGARPGLVASFAALTHVIAFLLPAVAGSLALDSAASWIPGYVAFALGFVAVPTAWIANPLFLLAFLWFRQGRLRRATSLAVVAAFLALTAAIALSNVELGPGFILWSASPVLLAIAAVLAERTAAPAEAAAPADS